MSSDKSASEHEPSEYGSQRFGLESLWIVAFLLIAVAIIGGLLWLANQSV